jgi:hypothetical protein
MRRHAVTRKGTKLATPHPGGPGYLVSPDSHPTRVGRQSQAHGEGVAWVWGGRYLLRGTGTDTVMQVSSVLDHASSSHPLNLTNSSES